jgi:hypothetical protein
MSAELEACKGAMKGMVHLLTDNHAAGQLSFAVITFTESESGCYTSLFESTSAEAAQDYMNGIKLCRPPEEPGVTADGASFHTTMCARIPEACRLIPSAACAHVALQVVFHQPSFRCREPPSKAWVC